MMMLPEMRTDAHSPQSCPMKMVPTVIASVQSVGRSIGCAAVGWSQPTVIRRANRIVIDVPRRFMPASGSGVRRNLLYQAP